MIPVGVVLTGKTVSAAAAIPVVLFTIGLIERRDDVHDIKFYSLF